MALSQLAKVFILSVDSIGDISIDAVISEAHDAEVEITEHPVEQGADIIDHARVKAETVTLDCIISNTPVASNLRFDAGGQKIEFAQGAPGRAQETYARLFKLKSNAKLVTVITYRKLYTNMLLKKLSMPVDTKTGETLRFQVSFTQVRVVKNKTIKVVTNTKQGKSKLGKQDAQPANAGVADSYLLQFGKWSGLQK